MFVKRLFKTLQYGRPYNTNTSISMQALDEDFVESSYNPSRGSRNNINLDFNHVSSNSGIQQQRNFKVVFVTILSCLGAMMFFIIYYWSLNNSNYVESSTTQSSDQMTTNSTTKLSN